jgi:hypothetical protein
MSKKFAVGLIVAFVVAAAMPLAAQAQERRRSMVSNCKYVGPAGPLALNLLPTQTGSKTIKAQKEIFYCYDRRTSG